MYSRRHTEETKIKISLSRKGKGIGCIPWNKDKKMSKDFIEKQKRNSSRFWLGKSRSQKTKDKIRDSLMGKKLPEDITEEDIQYTMKKHRLTREEVLSRLGKK